MKEVKAIVFDIGGVMAQEDNMKTHYPLLCKSMGINLKKFLSLRKKYIPLASTGKISGVEMIRRFAKDLGVSYKNLMENWIKYKRLSIRKNFPLEKLIIKLKKKGYRVGVLSGVIDIHHQVGVEKKLYDVFHFHIFSFRVGINKPDIRIYQLLLKNLKIHPKEIIVIDDMEICLKSARKLGMKTILYSGMPKLIRDLKKFGVST